MCSLSDRRLTKHQIKKIIERYTNGDSPGTISGELGISSTAVLYHLRKNDVNLRGRSEALRRKDLPDVEDLKREYLGNLDLNIKPMSTYALGKKYRIPSTTIYLKLKEAGVNMRDLKVAHAMTKQKKIPSTCGCMRGMSPFIREEDDDPYRIPEEKPRS